MLGLISLSTEEKGKSGKCIVVLC